ncbi:MAG TPA: SIS domain-containing protein, partial [archaeon]|nr:SIS domain-containing protein [archaeon]
IHSIPALIKKILEKENEIREIAKNLAEKKDIYIIGRGLSYPIAREIALKLKEISYIHAEGMMAGELKHGTIALIEQDTPVIALLDGNTHIISNAKEVEARGANVIALSSNSSPFNGIRIPSKCDGSFAILSAVAGQLLTYHIAKNKGLSIDKPRNLSKTITVL